MQEYKLQNGNRTSLSIIFELFLFFGQTLPFIIQFLLMEAGVIQFVAFIPQQQMIPQYLRVVDLIFQFDDMGSQQLDFIFDCFQAGPYLGTTAALFFTVGSLFSSVGSRRIFRTLGRISVLSASKFW